MGLLDSLLGAVTSGQGQQGSNPQAALIAAALGMLTNQSGAAGGGDLLSKLQQSGLADQVQSWLGQGANQSVSPEQI